MHRYISTLLLGAALMTPLALRADDHDRRVYDRDHKDYHQWNDREEGTYKKWVEENHRTYREFNRAPRRDQSAYWKWRHEHRDDDHR